LSLPSLLTQSETASLSFRVFPAMTIQAALRKQYTCEQCTKSLFQVLKKTVHVGKCGVGTMIFQ
jgi:hypothetical protein